MPQPSKNEAYLVTLRHMIKNVSKTQAVLANGEDVPGASPPVSTKTTPQS
jgi:hypothetical protein